MTPGTIIAADYPLIDSERQSLAKRIDAEIAPLVETLVPLHAFVAIMTGVGADCVIPKTFDLPLGPPIKLGAMMRDAQAAIAKVKQEERT